MFPQHCVQSDNHNYLILLRPATFVWQRENEGLNSPEEKYIKKTTYHHSLSLDLLFTKLFLFFYFLLRREHWKHKRDCYLWQSSTTWTYPIYPPQAISSSSSWVTVSTMLSSFHPSSYLRHSLLLQKAQTC